MALMNAAVSTEGRRKMLVRLEFVRVVAVNTNVFWDVRARAPCREQTLEVAEGWRGLQLAQGPPLVRAKGRIDSLYSRFRAS